MGIYYCNICFKSYTRYASVVRHKTEKHSKELLHQNGKAVLEENTSEETVGSTLYNLFDTTDITVRNEDIHNEDISDPMLSNECSNSFVPSQVTEEEVLSREETICKLATGNYMNLKLSEEIEVEQKNDFLGAISEDSDSTSSSTVSSDNDLDNDFDFEEDDDWLFELPSVSARNSGTGGEVKSKISVTDHASLVLGYAIRHNLSNKAVNDLLKLIDIHLPETNRNLLSHDAVKKKINNWVELDIKTIEYCEKCNATWPDDNKDEYICKTAGCSSLRYKGHNQEKKIINCFFVVASMEQQIKSILEREGMWDKLKKSFLRRNKSSIKNITDIIDGSLYRELTKPSNVLHQNNNITLTWNTDGVALFKSSRIELWPVYIAINEIPAAERFLCKNICLWGLWQGKGKPPTNAFCKAFVSDMKHIAIKGLNITITEDSKDCQIHLHAYPIVSSMDLIAKAPFLNMNQHNGAHGCSTCLAAGSHVKSGKGYAHCYSFEESETVSLRTSDSFYNDALKATQTNKKVNGLKGLSMIILLPKFDIVNGVVPDYMHGILLGVVRTLMSLWLDSTEHKNYYKENKSYPEYFIGHSIDDIDVSLTKMKPPDSISRRPRTLKGNIHHLKANEFRAWLLYYSYPCLQNILPTKYLQHFALLSEAVHILLGKVISFDDLEKARQCLYFFYRDFQILYEFHPGKCGLNVHNLIHLTEYVRWWGPLWAWSCFGFESLNGSLIKQVHGTKNGCYQVISSFSAIKNVHNVTDSSKTRDITKSYLSEMLVNNSCSNWIVVNEICRVAGKGISIDKELQSWVANNIGNDGGKLKKYFRAKINGKTFTGSEYNRVHKTANYVCLLQLANTVQICSICFFLHSEEKKKLFIVGNILERPEYWSLLQSWTTSQVMKIKSTTSEQKVIISSENVLEKLFLIDGNPNFPCVAKIPNNVESD